MTARPGLPAIDVLVATRAGGDRRGRGHLHRVRRRRRPGRGRASGTMAWALGQPIAAEFVDSARSRASLGRVGWTRCPSRGRRAAARPRAWLAMAGQSGASRRAVVGAVHLYFGELDEERRGPADRAGAAGRRGAAAQIYGGRRRRRSGRRSRRTTATLFLAVAGHELRTPVTVIKGYASMLADRWDALDEPATAGRRPGADPAGRRAGPAGRPAARRVGRRRRPPAGWCGPSRSIRSRRCSRRPRELPAELRRAAAAGAARTACRRPRATRPSSPRS